MKILVIGGKGTIGKEIVNELSPRHDVITAGRTNGDYLVDIASESDIRSLYQKIGVIDAVICAAGNGCFEPIDAISPEAFKEGVNSKLFGQINLVLIGKDFIAENGSFTLVSGVLSEDPIKGSTNVAVINSGIEGFVKSASIELSRGVRINAVSPGIVTESGTSGFFLGYKTVAAADVALAFSKSAEGQQTGKVYRVWS